VLGVLRARQPGCAAALQCFCSFNSGRGSQPHPGVPYVPETCTGGSLCAPMCGKLLCAGGHGLCVCQVRRLPSGGEECAGSVLPSPLPRVVAAACVPKLVPVPVGGWAPSCAAERDRPTSGVRGRRRSPSGPPRSVALGLYEYSVCVCMAPPCSSHGPCDAWRLPGPYLGTAVASCSTHRRASIQAC
jgi:hypothetical protein